MIENFLRPLRGTVDVGADVLRGLGVLSVVLATIFFDATDAGIVAFALPGLFFPRFIGMKAWADLAFGGTLLVAAWSNVLDLYTRIGWWDLAVHFVCTGIVAAGVYLLLAQVGIISAPETARLASTAGLILTTTIGLALCALWEMVEWIGGTYISDAIYTAYDDTIGDMAVGGFGALCAGFAIVFLPLLRTLQSNPAEVPRSSK